MGGNGPPFTAAEAAPSEARKLPHGDLLLVHFWPLASFYRVLDRFELKREEI
jgi:hypothetical protein